MEKFFCTAAEQNRAAVEGRSRGAQTKENRVSLSWPPFFVFQALDKTRATRCNGQWIMNWVQFAAGHKNDMSGNIKLTAGLWDIYFYNCDGNQIILQILHRKFSIFKIFYRIDPSIQAFPVENDTTK